MALDLFEWYQSLHFRRVDLVGDYAGNELFIIDGNSVLIDVFSNAKLDLFPGFQLLHATYLVEKFLHRLHQRKCHFHVVFFDDLSSACVPDGCSEEHRPRYLCARKLIVEHLRQNLTAAFAFNEKTVQVHRFQSYDSANFQKYLISIGAYFFMCHDGAIPGSRHNSPMKVGLRMMIQWFIKNGYNIALINNLECHDTKVMAMIVEGTSSSDVAVLEDVLPEVVKHNPDDTLIAEIIQKIHGASTLTQRDVLTISAIGYMFRTRKTNIMSESYILEAQVVLLQTILLHKYRLCDRVTDEVEDDHANALLNKLLQTMLYILESPSWGRKFAQSEVMCDLGDCIDGRLFGYLLESTQTSLTWDSFEREVKNDFRQFASIVQDVTGIDISHMEKDQTMSPECGSRGEGSDRKFTPLQSTVLPFRNPVFDLHLRSIHLDIEPGRGTVSGVKSRIFRELSHWHNSKRKLEPRVSQSVPGYIKTRQQRRSQNFLTDMRNYAASLNNAVGGILEPETIYVTSATLKSQRMKISEMHRLVTEANSEKQARKDEAFMKVMRTTMSDLDCETNLEVRYQKTKHYLASLTREKRHVMEAELNTYMVHILVQIWIKCCKQGKKNKSMHIPALICDTLGQLTKSEINSTSEMSVCVNKVVKALGLPKVSLHANRIDKLSFQFVDIQMAGLEIEMNPIVFQLVHMGPYMDRSIESAPDSRVHDFYPDKWQRQVLDQIDAKKSLFVVAPTSAGKTFISFYAMKQVLQEDDDGVLVYVAPTKALVNQIAAEIQARFSKTFRYAGKSVWAIHTRDYRINNATSAQILVTVPHILQIMLLSPSNAKTWSPRVKRIIFDEIHCIGQSDDGVIWEQLLLLASCPIIALSATVGNPEEFGKWLSLAQKANGYDLTMIKHPHRYSDLRNFVYGPPETFSFNGLGILRAQLQPLSLDGEPGMVFMHPIVSLIDRSRGMPDDLNLEPRDCLLLWMAMNEHQTPEFPLSKSLGPPATDVIRKADIVDWQERLLSVLKIWMDDHKSPFDAVLSQLGKNFINTKRSRNQISSEDKYLTEPTDIDERDLLDTTLPLLCSLHERDALPAILFNYDRGMCEDLAMRIVNQLEDTEKIWKENSKTWKLNVANWEKWKKNQEKSVKARLKNSQRLHRQDNQMTKNEQVREDASLEASPYASFDPGNPVDGFHFANSAKLTSKELQEYITDLTNRDVPNQFIDALKRGIGIHHAGMNRKYRQVCEILFRKGYLRVVIATGTLALGINMPCKTVVFSGDSVFLTALNFRQAAGRAGRRGFDVLGNVVFQGVPYSKVCRLLSSRLPDLNGHFPITTSLILRLMILLAESDQSPYAIRAVNSLLSSSRMCLGGEESRHTILHHLRFSIEYLRRNNLLSLEGKPLNFAGCISHLYYTENSSFAFHALLSNGYFHTLCRQIEDKPEDVLLEMVLVMSHIFGRHYLPQSVLESYETAVKKSPSVVVLPPLPELAAEILHAHNSDCLDIYAAYVSSFIDQHVKTDDCVLPFTHMKCGGNLSAERLNPQLPMRPPVRIISTFVALSGHRDGQWKSISDLCETVRSGVWLEESVVPYIRVYPDEGNTPLNAYLYDFFKHGNKTELIRANKVRRGDIWFVLNDFSLVLASIVTSLENLLNLSPEDANLDVAQSVGETHEQDLEDSVFGKDNSKVMIARHRTKPTTINKLHTVSIMVKKSKSKVPESWDDEETESEETHSTVTRETLKQDDEQEFSNSNSLDCTEDEPLRNVLRAFRMLQIRFDEHFKALWA